MDCRTVRAISSDRGKVVSGSDDQSVLVWDKQKTQLLEELNGHDAPVCLCRASLLSFMLDIELEMFCRVTRIVNPIFGCEIVASV